MKIVLVSSEVVPFAKTGGLADVAGALPGELEKLGHEVTVFMPGYQTIDSGDHPMEPTGQRCDIPVGHDLENCQIAKSKLPNGKSDIYFIQNERYFHREHLYNDAGGDYPDNCERFVFFCRSVLESIRIFNLNPDVIHVNDWQTGLIPALLACEYRDNQRYAKIASLLTIHNLAYQGVFDASHMASTGLDPVYFNWQQMEFYGQLNLLKTGIVFADAINTVSPTYAEEIKSEEQGSGLDSVLRHRSDRLSGILNGIDTDQWNPKTDPFLPANFDESFDPSVGTEGKAICKRELQTELRLEPREDVPLIGIVGRMATQKGWSLIIPVLRRWLETRDAQWVILGTGDPDFQNVLNSLHQSHANKLSLTLGFSNSLAHRIEAGSDLFLMPSQYEPCGLNQMYSMAYGTIPVVRRTGGLADTVIDVNADSIANQTATGFSFRDFTPEALDQAVTRAVDTYTQQRETWNQIMLNGMKRDWSWTASAKAYEALYEEAIRFRESDSQ